MATIAKLRARAALYDQYNVLRLDETVPLEERKAALEAVELSMHADREAIAQADSDARLDEIEREYTDRAARRDRTVQLRVAALVDQLESEAQNRAAAVAAATVKRSRKLARARNRSDQQLDRLTSTGTLQPRSTHRRDLIKEYSDAGSRVYAPLRRDGHSATIAGADVSMHVDATLRLPRLFGGETASIAAEGEV